MKQMITRSFFRKMYHAKLRVRNSAMIQHSHWGWSKYFASDISLVKNIKILDTAVVCFLLEVIALSS